MKTGYQDFFKKAQKVADRREPARRIHVERHPSKDVFKGASGEQLRTLLRKNNAKSAAPKRGLALKPIFSLAVMSGILGFGYANFEQVEKFVENVEISFLGSAQASNPAPAQAAAPAPAAKAEGAGGEPAAATVEKTASSAPATPEEMNHLLRLRERKAELDAREEELSRTESELNAQKKELEERLKKLESTRSEISTVLKDRAEADDKKVDDLVAVYSTMKPQQAAKIFESMDEGLAVEILGRMKKKPAAEILNLIKAEKAQMISEKYAGYKRKNQP